MDFLQSLAAITVILAGGYFTIRFRAFYLVHPIKTVRSFPKSGVKQMLLSLGGTVGVGNISGVAAAIMLGGAGAVFWMWTGAFFAMALKYAEITLGMLDKKGAVHYIKNALGTLAAALFSALLVLDVVMMGGMIQASAIAESVHAAIGISPLVCGIFVSLLAATVFFFKLDLFRLSSCVVPTMSVLYIVVALIVISAHLKEIPQAFLNIFGDAFRLESAAGGALGFLLTPAFRQGIVKGLFSNEAGCGTAPSAHASSNEKVPARQGLFGALEVFIDTVVMCTLTALVILLTLGENVAKIGGGGTYICVRAFESVIGMAAPPIIALFVFLFAFSAIVAFGYYGMEICKNSILKNAFLIVYCISILFGAVATPMEVWKIADAVICMMLLINTTAVLLSRKRIFAAHDAFYSHIGKYSQSASKTISFSKTSVKNAIPISDTETKRGSTP